MQRPRLSIFGRKLNSNNGSSKFDWKNAVIDSSIMAFLTFFSVLGSLGIVGSITSIIDKLLISFVSSMIEFFTILAIKRGLIRQEPTKKRR